MFSTRLMTWLRQLEALQLDVTIMLLVDVQSVSIGIIR